MEEKIKQILTEALKVIGECQTLASLDEARVRYTGKKSLLSEALEDVDRFFHRLGQGMVTAATDPLTRQGDIDLFRRDLLALFGLDQKDLSAAQRLIERLFGFVEQGTDPGAFLRSQGTQIFERFAQ